MGKRREQYTAQDFINAMPNTGGVVSAIAEKVGCAWNTADKYIKEHPTVAQAWRNERERIVDMAEMALFKKVKEGESWAIKYTLVKLGKERGYGDAVQVTGAVVISWDDADAD